MSTPEVWLVIAGMTMVAIVTRSLFLIAGDRMTLPTRVRHVLRSTPAAAFVAIALPDLPWNQDHFDASQTSPRLMVDIAAAAFYVITQRILGMIFVGMGIFIVLRLWGRTRRVPTATA